MTAIIPGRGLEPLVIGARLADVVKELGAPSKDEAFDDFRCVDWYARGLRAFTDLDGVSRACAPCTARPSSRSPPASR